MEKDNDTVQMTLTHEEEKAVLKMRKKKEIDVINNKEMIKKAVDYFMKEYNNKYIVARTVSDLGDSVFQVCRISVDRQTIENLFKPDVSFSYFSVDKDTPVQIINMDYDRNVEKTVFLPKEDIDESTRLNLSLFYNPYIPKAFFYTEKNVIYEQIATDDYRLVQVITKEVYDDFVSHCKEYELRAAQHIAAEHVLIQSVSSFVDDNYID